MTHWQVLPVFLVFLLSPLSFAFHVHPLRYNSSSTGLIHGHLLSPDTFTALQFTLQHSRPLVFFDELIEDGVRLSDATLLSGKRISLTLSGESLHRSDFITPSSRLGNYPGRDVVLCIQHSHLLLQTQYEEHNYVYLSIYDAIPVSVDSSDFSNFLNLTAKPIRMRDVITSITFTPLYARLRPDVPGKSAILRSFHVYGRHSHLQTTSRTKKTLPQYMIERFQVNPFRVCFAVSLGIGPQTTCDLDLFTVVHNETTKLPLTTSTEQNSNALPQPHPNASGNISLVLTVRTFGSYSKTTGRIKFTFVYSGNVSVSYRCPLGCSLQPTSGTVDISDYHKLLKTPGSQLLFPNFPLFQLRSSISVTWNTTLMAKLVNLTALNFRQPFSVAVKAGHKETAVGKQPVELNISMPQPIANSTDIVLGPVGDTDPETGLTNLGSSVSGAIALSSKITAQFRTSGTLVEGFVKYNHGVNIESDGIGSDMHAPMWSEGITDGICGACHQRRVSLEPYFVNVSGKVRSTAVLLGINDTDFDIKTAETGKPFCACFGEVNCLRI